MLRGLLLVIILCASQQAIASEAILGVWDDGQGTKLEILDGFKPNRGAILAFEKDKEASIGSWSSKDGVIEIQIGFSSQKAALPAPNTIVWKNKRFSKIGEFPKVSSISLKSDKPAFIERAVSHRWLTGEDGRVATFSLTFDDDSGVFAVDDKAGERLSVSAWGISSGVLKIGEAVLIDARVSDNYLIAIDQRDRFTVMKAVGDVTAAKRIALKDQNSQFLAGMTTDEWQSLSFGRATTIRFRPIEGPLKGRIFKIADRRLSGLETWEYSPGTGAIKVGYTEYVGALLLGDMLAFVKKNGEQEFYVRKPDGPGKQFTTSDVNRTVVNETATDQLVQLLSGQFHYDRNLYRFEFREDRRAGFVHRWESTPLRIVGQRMSTDFLGDVDEVYSIEDVLVFSKNDGFGTNHALRRDASESRLRPKSDAEALSDKEAAAAVLDRTLEKKLVLRVTGSDGKVVTIDLPFSTMADIVGIEIQPH